MYSLVQKMQRDNRAEGLFLASGCCRYSFVWCRRPSTHGRQLQSFCANAPRFAVRPIMCSVIRVQRCRPPSTCRVSLLSAWRTSGDVHRKDAILTCPLYASISLSGAENEDWCCPRYGRAGGPHICYNIRIPRTPTLATSFVSLTCFELRCYLSWQSGLTLSLSSPSSTSSSTSATPTRPRW